MDTRGRKTKNARLVPALLLLGGCAGSIRPERRDGSRCELATQAVERTIERLIAADNAKDLAGVLDCYSEDIVFIPPLGDEVRGKKKIEASYGQLFSGFNLSISTTILESRLSENWAFVRGANLGKKTAVAGGGDGSIDDKFIALLECVNNSWKVSRLMWSPRNP